MRKYVDISADDQKPTKADRPNKCIQCGKILPAEYNHKLCEACMNRDIGVAKKVGKVAVAAGGAVATGAGVVLLAAGKGAAKGVGKGLVAAVKVLGNLKG